METIIHWIALNFSGDYALIIFEEYKSMKLISFSDGMAQSYFWATINVLYFIFGYFSVQIGDNLNLLSQARANIHAILNE